MIKRRITSARNRDVGNLCELGCSFEYIEIETAGGVTRGRRIRFHRFREEEEEEEDPCRKFETRAITVIKFKRAIDEAVAEGGIVAK